MQTPFHIILKFEGSAEAPGIDERSRFPSVRRGRHPGTTSGGNAGQSKACEYAGGTTAGYVEAGPSRGANPGDSTSQVSDGKLHSRA